MHAMPASLLVVVFADGPRLDQTLASLDGQTSPPDRFDVLLVDDQQDQARTHRLQRLAGHRINVTWTSAPPDESLQSHLADRGHVVFVEPGDTLLPEAVDHLTGAIDTAEFDVMLTKTARPGDRVDAPVLLGDLSILEVDSALRYPDCGRVYSSALVRGLDTSLVRRDRRKFDELALHEATKVIWRDRPVFAKARSGGRNTSRWRATATAAEWHDGRLDVSVTLAGADGAALDSSAEVTGLVVGSSTGVEWAVPAAPAGASHSQWSFTVDPEQAAGGQPLSPGQTRIAVLVADQGGSESVPVRARGSVRHGSHVNGTSYVVHGDNGKLGLDVGGRAHPVARRIDVASARVVEDARGSLLTASVPHLQVAPGERLEGALRVGTLPFDAWIEPDDNGSAVLHSWVSGLSGTHALALRFSGGRFVRLRAQLVVDHVGKMSVELRPASRPKAAEAAKEEAPRWRRAARRVPGAGRAARFGRSAVARVRRVGA